MTIFSHKKEAMYFQFLYIASLLIILLFSFFNRVDYLIILSTGFPCKYNFFTGIF